MRRQPPPRHAAALGHRATDAYMRGFSSAPPPAAAAVHAADAAPPAPPYSVDLAALLHGDAPPAPAHSVGPDSWRVGPVDSAGELLDLSDRPLLAGCASGGGAGPLVAIGCADHSGFVVDAASGRVAATLFGRAVGHREWVTGCAFLGDGSGRVATCGMDGRVLLWAGAVPAGAGGPRRARGGGAAPLPRPSAWVGPPPAELTGHFGSVALLASPPGLASELVPTLGGALLSAGYDKTLRLWWCAPTPSRGSAGSRPGAPPAAHCVAVLRGHTAPVLCCAIKPACDPTCDAAGLVAASGDRDGVVRVWALSPAPPSPASGGVHPGQWAAHCVGVLAAHAGHVTAVAWVRMPGGDGAAAAAAPWRLLTGGQDGTVRVWCHSPTAGWAMEAAIPAHATPAGVGAVGEMVVACDGDAADAPPLVVTAGADGAVCVLDPAAGFSVRHRLETHTCSGGGAGAGAGSGGGSGGGSFLYALAAHGRLVLSGDGRGQLVCHDAPTGEPLWALGANAAAVRVIAVAGGGASLVAAGDDGKALVYRFAA